MRLFKIFSCFFANLAFSGALFAQAQILDGHGLNAVNLESALSEVKPGGIVVLGEEHGTKVQPLFQVQVMKTLEKMGHKVSVGMEFLNYPYQPLVDQYRAGSLSEADFLAKVKWGSFSYEGYKHQILFPKAGQGTTIALNAPAALTSKVAKTGVSSLTPSEAALMPPNFQKGNDLYFDRFRITMGDHLPSQAALGRYFEAQSIWDDTMAWKATEYIKSNPDQVLVIVVGEFHVQYGGGLPDRIKARGIDNVTTFSLINLNGMTEEEIKEEIAPSAKYGDRASYIWTDNYEREQPLRRRPF